MEVPIYNGTFCSFMLKVCCFVAIGALRVNTLTENANCQSSLGYRNETVLRRKMGYFRKSCPTNHDIILNYVTLKWGYQSIMGHSAVLCGKFVKEAVVNDISAYFRM